MKRPSVAQFISDKRAEGLSDSDITHQLLDAGWHMDIIHKAMTGEPIRQRNLEPILGIRKQPLRKYAIPILIVIAIVIAGVLATFA